MNIFTVGGMTREEVLLLLLLLLTLSQAADALEQAEAANVALRGERDALGKGIRDAALKAGIVREDSILTGPHLLMLCNDMAEALRARLEAQPVDPEKWLPCTTMAPLEHSERQEAEHAYSMTAFDYARDPIGSRDWQLYWKGWWHRFLARAALTSPHPAEANTIVGTTGAQGGLCNGVRFKLDTVANVVKALRKLANNIEHCAELQDENHS